ncbi:MAG: DNA ligase [bacterium]|nr:DNA ligase [bacterium]
MSPHRIRLHRKTGLTALRSVYAWFLCLLVFSSAAQAEGLLLAREYQQQDVRGWAMSEKLDGVRAFWDGKRLLSRNGHAFTPSSDFTRDFPPFALDGELYSSRGQFERISAAVRSYRGDWSGLKLHVFDVPHAEGNLYQRLAVLEKWLDTHPQVNIVCIAQHEVRDFAQVQAFLRQIEAGGGEGVMLRDPNAGYAAGRSNQLLKLKSLQDAECTVTAHHAGKGKYRGELGAFSCRNEHGAFRIGTGLSDADRSNPPPIGTVITYRHRGFTAKGLPRFPSYLRIRSDLEP